MSRSQETITGKAAFVTRLKSGRPAIAYKCRRCDREEVSSDKPDCPLDTAIKHANREGWEIHRNGASALCPSCIKKECTDRTVDEGKIQAELERQRAQELRRKANEEPKMSTPTPAPPAPKSPEAIKAERKMHSLLERHLTVDGEPGPGAVARYDEGWSDQAVADAAGLIVDQITRTREAAYGRLVDPRVAAVESMLVDAQAKIDRDIADVQRDIEAQRTVLAELQKLAESIRSDGLQVINNLRERVDTLKGRR